jgi:hypothetical protein
MSEGECGRRGLCPGGPTPDRHAELVTDFCYSQHPQSQHIWTEQALPQQGRWLLRSISQCLLASKHRPYNTLCQSPAALLAALQGPDCCLFTCGRTTHLHTKTKLSCRANRSILCADVLFPGNCPDSSKAVPLAIKPFCQRAKRSAVLGSAC